MIKHNQKGFSVFEACIIALVVVLLALGAWFIWDNNKDKDYEQTANTTLQTEQGEAADEVVANNKTYLTIKEWNVQFTLDDSIKDAYYAIEEGKPEYAYLSVHSLTNAQCAPDKTSVGVITRFKQGDRDPIYDKPYTEVVPDAIKVGNYYYFFSNAQAYCDESKEATLKAVAKSFEEAVKTAETANTP